LDGSSVSTGLWSAIDYDPFDGNVIIIGSRIRFDGSVIQPFGCYAIW